MHGVPVRAWGGMFLRGCGWRGCGVGVVAVPAPGAGPVGQPAPRDAAPDS